MSQKRGKYEIVRDILRICQHGANKTRIVYKANLNFAVLGRYKKDLEENGLIAVEEGKLVITEKGSQALRTLETATAMLSPRSITLK